MVYEIASIVIDEDILPVLLKQGTMEIAEFGRLCGHLQLAGANLPQSDHVQLHTLNTVIANAPEKFIQPLPEFDISSIITLEGMIAQYRITTNIIGFLSATHFIKSGGKINFITRRELLQGKKIIILSATVDESMYRRFFGDRLGGFYDIGQVKPRGRIKQYPQRSFSRYALTTKPELMNIGRSIAEDCPVITFKGAANGFTNPVATFGATAGLDTYTGKDIVVFGTPHLHPTVYMLYAKALGMSVDGTEAMNYQKVRWRGCEFWFQTYRGNSELQALQLHLIEAELLQAIGRARILRNDCTVTVLSSFPVVGAEFIYLGREELNGMMAAPESANQGIVGEISTPLRQHVDW